MISFQFSSFHLLRGRQIPLLNNKNAEDCDRPLVSKNDYSFPISQRINKTVPIDPVLQIQLIPIKKVILKYES